MRHKENINNECLMAFCIEDGYNTSYIDSTLIALFYKPTHLHELLTQLPENIKFTYLQDIVMINFVEQLRKNYSINSSYVNEIRNYSIICGWKNMSQITEEHDANEYLLFLLNGFSLCHITIETVSLKSIVSQNIILELTEDSNLKNLLNKWIDVSTNKIQYKFVNLPQLIPIYINRKHEGLKIDIMKKIKFYNNPTQNTASWIVHSLICKTRSHYYSLVYTVYGDWYLFDNKKLPSVIKIDITSNDITEKIKQECIIILYRIDDMLCCI